MNTLPIRIALDVTAVVSGSTGIARYVRELSRALERRGVDVRRFAVGRSKFPPPPDTVHARIPVRLLEPWWRLAGWPRVEGMVGGADLAHATSFVIPATRRPLVVTVHDLAALRHPELHPARHVAQQQALVKQLTRAAAVVCVSGATADDLTHAGVDDRRLVIAPLGLTALGDPSPAAARPRAGYLLTVGETAPRKGYHVLLRALSSLAPDVRLVMAGPSADEEQRLRSLAAELGVASRVTRLAAVTDPELAGLYADALGLCFPSVAEGFGLPLLEAMAAGLPILASDIPISREVAGDAAIYLDRDDHQAWADAIEALASDRMLRERLAAAGRRRAARFTWDRTAGATIEAYRLALGDTG